MSLAFIILTIFIFIFLLALLPKILYFATLIYHVFFPKKKIKGSSRTYKLSDLKDLKTEKKVLK